MNLIIADLLQPARLAAIAEALDDPALFGDGADTAGPLARPLKRNLQARDGATVRAALSMVEEALLAHPMVRSAARPRRVVRLLANRYQTGMQYGRHVDEPIIDGERTDLSFTLALNDCADYEGGALVIETDDQEQSFRLQRGELLLYPATSLHRVDPVTRGERRAIVGWIRSWIADAAQRSLLFDLDRTIDLVAAQAGPQEALDRLQRSRAQLMRMWAG